MNLQIFLLISLQIKNIINQRYVKKNEIDELLESDKNEKMYDYLNSKNPEFIIIGGVKIDRSIKIDGNVTNSNINTGDNVIIDSFNNAKEYLKKTDKYDNKIKEEIKNKLGELEGAIKKKNEPIIRKVGNFIKENWNDIYTIVQPAILIALGL